jgi:hypothetical protein
MHLKNNGLQDAARRKAILFCTVRGSDAGDILAKIVGEPNAPGDLRRRCEPRGRRGSTPDAGQLRHPCELAERRYSAGVPQVSRRTHCSNRIRRPHQATAVEH